MPARFCYLSLLILFLTAFIVSHVSAHDAYTNLRSPAGQLCCGGDPKTGDCEGIVDYRVNIDGTATFISKRYGGVSVLIGADKITWLSVAGGEAYEAHWCGVPRTKAVLAPVVDDNPDPAYWTYCAFIAPGGV